MSLTRSLTSRKSTSFWAIRRSRSSMRGSVASVAIRDDGSSGAPSAPRTNAELLVAVPGERTRQVVLRHIAAERHACLDGEAVVHSTPDTGVDDLGFQIRRRGEMPHGAQVACRP